MENKKSVLILVSYLVVHPENELDNNDRVPDNAFVFFDAVNKLLVTVINNTIRDKRIS
ncbi:MAG TPA: hypothetical protein PK604_07025 [Acetivibrio clariflavus]|nr:hypothetical protein [Acetivibrio clariflavus]